MCFTSVSLFLLKMFNLASKSFRMYTKEGIKYFCLWRWESMCIWFGNLYPPPMSRSIVEGWWGRLVLVEMSIRKGRLLFCFFGSWFKVPQMPWSPTSKSKWVGEPDQILSYNKVFLGSGCCWRQMEATLCLRRSTSQVLLALAGSPKRWQCPKAQSHAKSSYFITS